LGLGIWDLVFGTWYLGLGIWDLVFGTWYLGLGIWDLVFGTWYLGFGIWDLGFGIWNLGLGIWNLEFGTWYLGFGIWDLVFGIWNLGLGIWDLVFGTWYLEFGIWDLVFGTWYLGFGIWDLGLGLCLAVKSSIFVLMHPYHRELLTEIKKKGGKPVRDAFLQNYLGNPHPLYKLNSATMRKIAREWMARHRDISPDEFTQVIRSLVLAKTCTEKLMAGLLLDSSRDPQRAFDPALFDRWLTHLVGWVEVDTLCTGRYPEKEVPRQWTAFKKLLNRLSRDPHIQKRRASLVLLCSPLRKNADRRLLDQALKNVDRLGVEKKVLITKAVSWVLRSAAVHFPREVKKFVTLNESKLPRIAVRETLTKIDTGTKNKPKRK
jgi:3-methyladenine DNA glycosylase AlkD